MKNTVILLMFSEDLSSMIFQLPGSMRDGSPKLNIPSFDADCPIGDIEGLLQEQMEICFGFKAKQLTRNYINNPELIGSDKYVIYTCIYPCHPGPITPACVADNDWYYIIKLSDIADDVVGISGISSDIVKHVLWACRNPKRFKNEIVVYRNEYNAKALAQSLLDRDV